METADVEILKEALNVPVANCHADSNDVSTFYMWRYDNMYLYVGTAAFLFLVQLNFAKARPSPVHVTIDCSSDEKNGISRSFSRSRNLLSDESRFDVESFCSLIQRSLPKAVEDGRIILAEPDDQMGFADTQTPIFTAPPIGIQIPELRLNRLRPRLKVPKLKVPKLRGYANGPTAPRIGATMKIHRYRASEEEESSAEKMERFKKGVQKLLHVVKVLGQIDQYLSERTRIVVDKLSKTLTE